MIRAISQLESNSKSKNVSFTSQLKSHDLPLSKKMTNLQKDSFTKNMGPVCGIDLSFEDA